MTERPPLVSVIIPCRDQGHFLADAISSVHAQTHPRVETIVVDDGSRDDTAAVASRHAGVRLLRRPHSGLAVSRNAGLAASHGSVVVFLDADDRLLPDALAVGVAALQRHPDCAFVFGRHRRIDANGAPLPQPIRDRVDGDHYREFLRRNHIAMPGVVAYRRSALPPAPFDTRVAAAADYALYLRLAREHRVHDHYVEVAEYRRHGDNMSRNAGLMLAATLRVVWQHRPRRTAPPADRAAWRDGIRAAAFFYDRLFGEFRFNVVRGRWRAAARDLGAIVLFAPIVPGNATRKIVHLALRPLTRPAGGAAAAPRV